MTQNQIAELNDDATRGPIHTHASQRIMTAANRVGKTAEMKRLSEAHLYECSSCGFKTHQLMNGQCMTCHEPSETNVTDTKAGMTSIIEKFHPLRETMEAVEQELVTAMANWPPWNSAHEGWAIISEEFNKELWEHVCTKQKNRDLVAMKKEAIQVAAMAIRFAMTVCDETVGRR